MLAHGKCAHLGEGDCSKKYSTWRSEPSYFFRLFKVALYSRKQMKSLGAEIRQRISD